MSESDQHNPWVLEEESFHSDDEPNQKEDSDDESDDDKPNSWFTKEDSDDDKPNSWFTKEDSDDESDDDKSNPWFTKEDFNDESDDEPNQKDESDDEPNQKEDSDDEPDEPDKPKLENTNIKTPYYNIYPGNNEDIDLNKYCDKTEDKTIYRTKEIYDNVYVIGDIHGDYNALISILTNINCIIVVEREIRWNPEMKNICIIQTGDIMDGYRNNPSIYNPKEDGIADEQIYIQSKTRKNYVSRDLEIIRLLLKLKKEANLNDSEIILLYGNHELMNLFNIIDLYKLRLYGYTVNNINLLNFKKIDSMLRIKNDPIDGTLISKCKECKNKFECSCESIQNLGFENYMYEIKNTDSIETIITRINELKTLKKDIICNYKTYAIVNNYLFCHSGFVSEYANELLHVIHKKYPDDKLKDYLTEIIEEEPQTKINIINEIISKILYSLYEVYSDDIQRYKKDGQVNNEIIEDVEKYKNILKNLMWNTEFRSMGDEPVSVQKNIILRELNPFIQDIIKHFKVNGIIIGHYACSTIKNLVDTVNNNFELFNIDNSMSEGFHGIQTNFDDEEEVYIKRDFQYLKISENPETKKQAIQILNAPNLIYDTIKNDFKQMGLKEENIKPIVEQ